MGPGVGLLDKMLHIGEGRQLKKLEVIARQVNFLEDEYTGMSDEDLRGQTGDLKQRYENGESLDSLLPEAFATVREASTRVLDKRHFDVQIMGGAALHQCNIAEMKTGEGKTLVGVLPSYLNALTGKGVHVVTVNDYLAQFQSEQMGRIHHFLGLDVGAILAHMDPAARRVAYAADVTYGTNNEFGFDYLRDNMALSLEDCVQRGHYFAIVDEADSILIDEARTPLIIGANNQPTQEEANAYVGADELAATLIRVKDFKYDPAERKAELNASGRRKVQAKAGHSSFVTLTVDGLYEYVERALRAQIAYILDRDYVVHEKEIVIVDEFTGRMMPGRQWQDGLHQAIQAKERQEVSLETITAARVTVQDFFLKYKKLAGMTGTASSDAAEMRRIYKVRVFPVRTNRKGCRAWDPDRIFSTEDEKFQAVAERIVELNHFQVPVLIGTRSIEKSEKLSALLNEAGIEHQILNAKNHAIEAQIVAQAGQASRVTVATNMAGRGTDIKLTTEVVSKGGLHVIGTERHESLRIDRQLAGRCARQGDPGHAQFFVSLEDELFEAFGEKPAARMRKKYRGKGELTSGPMRRLIFTAQAKKERQHRRDRKLLMVYEKQRAEMRKNMGLNPVLG